jgi:hypothetical protein
VDIRVERGNPTDEEIAGLVAVLLRASATPAESQPPAHSRWALSARPGYAARDGRPARPGPHGWRISALPR